VRNEIVCAIVRSTALVVFGLLVAMYPNQCGTATPGVFFRVEVGSVTVVRETEGLDSRVCGSWKSPPRNSALAVGSVRPRTVCRRQRPFRSETVISKHRRSNDWQNSVVPPEGSTQNARMPCMDVCSRVARG
jgi:hypothetical protein